MECKDAFLCYFVLFFENKSIVSAPEGHGIQEIGGLVWPLLEWVVHRRSGEFGAGGSVAFSGQSMILCPLWRKEF
jgi:hypothetical protein